MASTSSSTVLTSSQSRLPPYCLKDPNSFANIHQFQLSHVHLNLSTHFPKKILAGHAILTFRVIQSDQKQIVLDTANLCIQQVEDVTVDQTPPHPLKFELSDLHEKFGKGLTLYLNSAPSVGSEILIKITYETTPQSMALQWLEPSQTLGKSHPYLFTQCQAIHCRSLVPIQDTPAIKITYSASITVQAPLRALMSALNESTVENKSSSSITYSFKQPKAIPSYLMALAVGNLEGLSVGPRSTVWAEPEVVKQAAEEFSETETFIQTAEHLISPYAWQRYDILLLPPSYPFGGMENSCLTFLTPTLLAGDKSLTDVVAHEISHSWSGNLVTTLNWEHFWLNEGWTMFIERKIIGKLKGEPHRQFSAIIGLKALQENIELFGVNHPYTALVPKLTETDPDDVFSSIPYEKGFNFLYYLEQLLGGPSVFEPYMKSYFIKFAGQSITTDQWKSYLFEYFRTLHPEKVNILETQVDWKKWFYGPGMCPVANEFDQTLANNAVQLANRWTSTSATENFSAFSPSDMSSFSSLQKVVFLETLDVPGKPLSHTQLKKMDEFYQLTEVHNNEIKFRWQMLCLHASYEPIYDEVVKFATSQGRMKYTRPLYRALSQSNENGKKLAIETFSKYKMTYHPICGKMVAKDLGVSYDE